MVSPQTVFTYPFHHAKLQILLHGVTANSLYLSFSPCKATNLTTWCHRKQSLQYPFHHAKLQILPIEKLQLILFLPYTDVVTLRVSLSEEGNFLCNVSSHLAKLSEELYESTFAKWILDTSMEC